MTGRFDVAIIGAGFSGSILAWILAKQGRSVALIDKERHPRFAIGESSTPIADLLLRRLADRYQLRELSRLSTYGSWKTHHPQLTCGRKRGFSYYLHRPGESFRDTPRHDRSLLVAASASDQAADTQWYRPDVDAFFYERAVAAGAHGLCGFQVDLQRSRVDRLTLVGSEGERRQVDGDWIVDASGAARVLARLADVGPAQSLGTSQSVFAHFTEVGSWTEWLNREGMDTQQDPFDGDDAAQHHLMGGAWMWMLRFDNGITSVGMTAQSIRELDWTSYPALSELMSGAVRVAPEHPGRTSGTRRLFDPVIDARRVLLPTAAVSADPLHSTGIAHALAGVDRVAAMILSGKGSEQESRSRQYRRAVMSEARLANRMIQAAYATMEDFPRFTTACMLYFAGAIACEERYGAGDNPDGLWNADDARFTQMVEEACRLLESDAPTQDIEAKIRRALSPWNTAGLMDPSVNNRYAYTATK